MALLIDGVFFQLAQTGIARLWAAVLPLLAKRLDVPIVFLDRGGFNERLDGVEIIPFPAFKSKYNAGDSELLERMCRHYGAKAFASTYYSTPMETPSLQLVYDMIPERLGFDLSPRDWREKEIGLLHARRHMCISMNTRKDLLEFYPELDPATTNYAHCGIDPTVFRPRDASAVEDFRHAHSLHRPYFMFVGSRVGANNYKNANLFFDDLENMPGDFDVLCVGGEKSALNPADSGMNHRIVQVALDDDSLATAYSGAAALVYPSLYEGFGLPVAEAMGCHCPVVCTSHGSLTEVAADAALTISGTSVPELIAALEQVQVPSKRQEMIERGARHAAKFRWEPFADTLAQGIRLLVADSDAGTHREFYERWASIRRLQGEVDVDV